MLTFLVHTPFLTIIRYQIRGWPTKTWKPDLAHQHFLKIMFYWNITHPFFFVWFLAAFVMLICHDQSSQIKFLHWDPIFCNTMSIGGSLLTVPWKISCKISFQNFMMPLPVFHNHMNIFKNTLSKVTQKVSQVFEERPQTGLVIFAFWSNFVSLQSRNWNFVFTQRYRTCSGSFSLLLLLF